MEKNIKSYKDLEVWRQAMTLVEMTYQTAQRLPEREKYNLVDQMCRAAISVPANIAEGHGSGHRKVFQRHLSISMGSLMELETYLLLCRKLNHLSEKDLEPVLQQLQVTGRLFAEG